MKKRPFVYLIPALIIALVSCNDHVFHIISVEPPITDPLINGSPVNFVVFKNNVYAASGGSIYSYNGTNWNLIPSMPGGRIMQLAATDSYLYALCFQNSWEDSILKRSSSCENWEDVKGVTDGYDRLQSVYAANDRVFIGARAQGDSYVILYIDEALNNDFKPLTPGGTTETPESMLCGVAYDSDHAFYYLCTRGNTIFRMPAAGKPVKLIADDTFTGIINLGIKNIIVAISRGGNLYNVNAGVNITVVSNISLGSRPSTGALAVWTDPANTSNRLLLAGRQDRLDYAVDSGYTYGYMELELDSGGIKNGKDFTVPGIGSPSSVDNYERYVSTIGKFPINHIFQAPKNIDPDMTLFASTQKNGVWSYRERDGVPQWNAEE